MQRVEAHALRPARSELLRVEGDEPLTRRFKRRIGPAGTGQELMQLEGEEWIAGPLAAAIPFGLAGDGEKALQGGPRRVRVDAGIGGKTLRGGFQGTGRGPDQLRLALGTRA